MLAILMTIAAIVICTTVIFTAVSRITDLENKLRQLRIEAISMKNELNEKERRIREYKRYAATLERHIIDISAKIEERGNALWEEET